AKAATRFFRKLLKGLEYVPRVLVTGKLASYGVAHRRLIPGVEHRRSKYLNNRAGNSHQPTRAREPAMRKFTSPGHAQRFLSAFSGISSHSRPRRHRLSAEEYRGIPTRDGHPIHHLEQNHRHSHGSRLSAAAEIDPGHPTQVPRVHRQPKI